MTIFLQEGNVRDLELSWSCQAAWNEIVVKSLRLVYIYNLSPHRNNLKKGPLSFVDSYECKKSLLIHFKDGSFLRTFVMNYTAYACVWKIKCMRLWWCHFWHTFLGLNWHWLTLMRHMQHIQRSLKVYLLHIFCVNTALTKIMLHLVLLHNLS